MKVVHHNSGNTPKKNLPERAREYYKNSRFKQVMDKARLYIPGRPSFKPSVKRNFNMLLAGTAMLTLVSDERADNKIVEKLETPEQIVEEKIVEEEAPPEPTADEILRSAPTTNSRQNFINTITELAKTKQYIMLEDTDHTRVSIRQLIAREDVLQGMQDAGITTFVKEGPIAENQGFSEPSINAEDYTLEESWEIVERALKGDGYLQNINHLSENEQNAKLDEALNSFIAKLKANTGWKKDNHPAYTEEFGRYAREAYKKKGLYSDKMATLLYAFDYLEDAAQLPQAYSTVARIIHGIKNDGLDLSNSYNPDNSPYHKYDRKKAAAMDSAQVNFMRNIAKTNLKLYFPDPGYEAFDQDEALYDIFSKATDRYTGDDVYDVVLGDAQFNQSQGKDRQAYVKLMKFLDKRISEAENGAISQNIKNETGDEIIAGIYGQGHFEYQNDINEMLGDKAVTIALLASPDDYISFHDSNIGDRTIEDVDLPDYFYVISTDQIYKIEPGSLGEKLYLSRMLTSISDIEYKDAVKKLPDDLKNHALPYSEYDNDPDNNQIKDIEEYYKSDKQWPKDFVKDSTSTSSVFNKLNNPAKMPLPLASNALTRLASSKAPVDPSARQYHAQRKMSVPYAARYI